MYAAFQEVIKVAMNYQVCFWFIWLTQEFRREGWTETAIMVCKLNKSL